MTATTVGATRAGRPRAVAALARPSAAYHLALGSGGLLIVLGLIMVLSESREAS